MKSFIKPVKTAVIAVGALAASITANAQEALNETEAALLAAIDANFDAQLQHLKDVVDMNSGTLHLEGVKNVADFMVSEFDGLGFDSQWIAMPKEMNRAGHLKLSRSGTSGPKLLLIGHLDTVFPKESPFQKHEVRGDRLYGPGVADMKGGNAVILYALKALNEQGLLDDTTINVFYTGDEESTGKPLSISRKDLIDTAKASDIALNFEGGAKDTAVVGRRGSSNWSLKVRGVRAHSSGIFSDRVGAGAIFEASRILHRFYEEVRVLEGLTFNAGHIAGGTFVTEGVTDSNKSTFGKSNVVPQTLMTSGGLRFMNEAQKEEARAIMRRIVADNLPRTTAEITFEDSYPAMQQTDNNLKLLGVFSDASNDVGIGTVAAFPPERRGAADISFVAPHIAYSMDGLGVIGSGAHAPGEWASIEGMREMTKRATVFLYRLLHTDALEKSE